MGRSKENQKLFDAIGEVEYNKKLKYNRNLRDREYRKIPKNKKIQFLKDWKRRGITFGEMTDSMYYDVIFLPATICMSCEKVFDNTICNDKKCNDHNNKLKETDPLFVCNVRGVICFQCNIQDNWKKRLTPNSIYHQYLTKPPLTNTLINTNKNSTDKG